MSLKIVAKDKTISNQIHVSPLEIRKINNLIIAQPASHGTPPLLGK